MGICIARLRRQAVGVDAAIAEGGVGESALEVIDAAFPAGAEQMRVPPNQKQPRRATYRSACHADSFTTRIRSRSAWFMPMRSGVPVEPAVVIKLAGGPDRRMKSSG